MFIIKKLGCDRIRIFVLLNTKCRVLLVTDHKTLRSINYSSCYATQMSDDNLQAI